MTHKTVQIALLGSAASILFSLESLIQSPVPIVRLGLANIVTILCLKWWGIREALVVVLVRVVLGSFVTGKFLHPVFLLSLSGGIVATFAMGATIIYGKQVFSLIGVSIIGALFHNVTQLSIAYFLYVRQIQIFFLLPLFLFSSTVSGIVIGFLSYILDEKMNMVPP